MVEAKQIADWEHTAVLSAMVNNASPNRKGAAQSPIKFHPYLQRKLRTKRMTRQAARQRLHAAFGLKKKRKHARDGADQDDADRQVE